MYKKRELKHESIRTHISYQKYRQNKHDQVNTFSPKQETQNVNF